MLKMARSNYYYKKAVDLQKQKDDADLRDRIEKIAVEYERYGYRRVTAQLQREGLRVNHKRVQRIMQEEELICKMKKRWVVTTDSNHPYPVYPNLLKDAKITGVNQAWVSDITYIRILTAFVYLAVILDVFSRKVVGWAISLRIDTELTRAALRMAIETRCPPRGCIHHSDRGVQYAAHEYVDDLKAAGFLISMSRKGNPYDNAQAESFMKTLKNEEVYLWEYKTFEDVKKRIPYFIEEVYNEKRLHSALGYCPPNEYESLVARKDNNRQTQLTSEALCV
jgi:putative transposase